MVTVYQNGPYTEETDADGNITVKALVTVYCLSTDSKPTNVANGSTCIEINTGKAFLFNEGGSAWVEVQ